jgi:hypothetical protein
LLEFSRISIPFLTEFLATKNEALMTHLEFGSLLSPGDADSSRPSTPRKTYDDLAGSAMLRRVAKSAARSAPLRGDQTSTLLAARSRPETEDRLGRKLREFYQKMLREPVPERFVALLDTLESKDR